jgi:hypothetical protein
VYFDGHPVLAEGAVVFDYDCIHCEHHSHMREVNRSCFVCVRH